MEWLETNQDLLIVVLIALLFVLGALIVLLMLKKRRFSKPGTPPPQEPVSETGPTDEVAIKERIAESFRKPPPPALRKDVSEDELLKAKSGMFEWKLVKKPPAGAAREAAAAPQAEAAPEKPAEEAPAESSEEAQPGTAPRPQKAPAKKQAKAAPPEPQAPAPKSVKAPLITTADLLSPSESMVGSTVRMQGGMKLSSRGKTDFWYLLEDENGSAVVRSEKQIKKGAHGLTGTVQKTKLGQLYIDAKSVS